MSSAASGNSVIFSFIGSPGGFALARVQVAAVLALARRSDGLSSWWIILKSDIFWSEIIPIRYENMGCLLG
jgi:hypothetical protein